LRGYTGAAFGERLSFEQIADLAGSERQARDVERARALEVADQVVDALDVLAVRVRPFGDGVFAGVTVDTLRAVRQRPRRERSLMHEEVVDQAARRKAVPVLGQ